MAEADEQLREENIRLRQQPHYYQSLHAKAVAKLQEAEGIIAALKEKLAEMARRLFGRSSEKDKTGRSSDSTPGTGKRPRGQQPGRPGHGRQKRPNLPEQKLLVDLPGGAPLCGQCGRPYHRNGTARSYVELVLRDRTCATCSAGDGYGFRTR